MNCARIIRPVCLGPYQGLGRDSKGVGYGVGGCGICTQIAEGSDAVGLMNARGAQALTPERRSEDDAYGIVTRGEVACRAPAGGRGAVSVGDIMGKEM